MQFAKDSFYMALHDRLAALNPARTVMLSGATRPAVIVAENEQVIPVEPLPDAFYLEWGAAIPVEGHAGSRTLMKMDCVLSYHTLGTVASGVDRGRTLAALDTELMTICEPQETEKRDYSQTPSVDLGTAVMWLPPALGAVTGSEAKTSESLPNRCGGVRLGRTATVSMFFFPEVNLL
jgi:hypothetical protein